MYSTSPAFNLKAVLKETGIAADTLRAWERRYGLPLPQRSPGGHRLYSQRDIETIKWLMKRQEEGLSISRAVELWNEQSATGVDPLAGSLQATFTPPAGLSLENIRREWLAACFNYDTVEAEQILNEAFAVNSVEITCIEVIMRGMHEIGELWHKGVASVQQEHFASGIAMRRLEALISASPPPTRPETVLTACPPDEWHVFPILLTTLFLRRRGWNVVNLGAVVPLDRLEETIERVRPQLVVLSAQTLMTAVSLRDMARFLNERGLKTAFGGRVFNHLTALPARIPAYFLGNTLESAIPTMEKLIINPPPIPAEVPTDRRMLKLAATFRENRGQIESTVVRKVTAGEESVGDGDSGNNFIGSVLSSALDTANLFTGNILIAAMELGDISYTSADIGWLTNLLIGRNITVSMLPLYLRQYAQAIEEVLGKTGQPLYDWLMLEAQKLNA